MLLYKYRSLLNEEHYGFIEDIILENHLYLAIPSTFNDPFEYRFTMPHEQLSNGLSEEKSQYTADYMFEHLRQSMGVVSFSTQSDNILMWSYYADNHRGICIEFNASIQDTVLSKARPVFYQDSFPKVTINPREMKQILLSKSSKWAHEKEWRIIDKEGGRRLKFEPTTLRSIILGCQISDFNKERILKLLHRLNRPLNIYQAKIRQGHYRLDIVPFSSK